MTTNNRPPLAERLETSKRRRPIWEACEEAAQIEWLNSLRSIDYRNDQTIAAALEAGHRWLWFKTGVGFRDIRGGLWPSILDTVHNVVRKNEDRWCLTEELLRGYTRTPQALKWIKGHDIDLTRMEERWLLVGAGIALLHDGGFFEPCERELGVPVIIAPLWLHEPVEVQYPLACKHGAIKDPIQCGSAGTLVDIAAINPKTDRAYLRRGMVNCLGYWGGWTPEKTRKLRPGERRKPEIVKVHLSPLNWLRAGGKGVCPLDWDWFARAVIGDQNLALVAADVNEGETIQKYLEARREKSPDILVQPQSGAA